MPEEPAENREVDPVTERSDRAWLEGQVRELESVNEGLQASNRQLTARIHFLRGEIDRLGRIVRVGGVVRGAVRDPRRLRLLRLDIAQALQPRPIVEPDGGARRPDPALTAAAERATVLAAIEERRRIAPSARQVRDLRVGLVADPSLHHLLDGVCTIVPLGPDDAPATIAGAALDLVLVESAWAGADGTWRYRIAWHPHQRSMQQVELAALVKAARSAGVPTAFWLTAARHDVPRFADAARRFDHLFATDDASLDRLSGDRERRWVTAALLHPGVRVDRHHPTQAPADASPLFLGSLPLALSLERREAIEGLLRTAAPRGLVLADRQAGGDPSRFGRPDVIAGVSAIRPSVSSIAGLYQQHRVVLLPSYAASSAAVPARLLEALATGVPVITTRSDAALGIVGDLVVASDDPAEIAAALDEGLGSDAWLARVRAGAPAIALEHDIRRRLAAIARTAGIAVEDPGERVDVQVLADDPATFARLADALRSGDADAVGSIVVGTTDWDAARAVLPATLSAALPGRSVRIVEQSPTETPEARHRRLAAVADRARVAIVDVGSDGQGAPAAAAGGLAGLLGCAAASGAAVVGLPLAGGAAHEAAAALRPYPALIQRDLVLERGWPVSGDALAGWRSDGIAMHSAPPALAVGGAA